MYSYCLGIRPSVENPGCKTIKFMPYFDLSGKITSAKGHYDTDYGRVLVEWGRKGESFIYTVNIPETVNYKFDFPGMKIVECTEKENIYKFELQAK